MGLWVRHQFASGGIRPRLLEKWMSMTISTKLVQGLKKNWPHDETPSQPDDRSQLHFVCIYLLGYAEFSASRNASRLTINPSIERQSPIDNIDRDVCLHKSRTTASLQGHVVCSQLIIIDGTTGNARNTWIGDTAFTRSP